MTTFLAIVTIVAGVLQIILFFKIWGMTNNVSAIKNTLSDENRSAYILQDGQASALAGDNETAIRKYKEAFLVEVLVTYNEIASSWGEGKQRDMIYANRYKIIVSQYEKRIEKVGGHLETEKYDTFTKVRDIVSDI